MMIFNTLHTTSKFPFIIGMMIVLASQIVNGFAAGPDSSLYKVYEEVPFHYEIIQSNVEPYWIRIVNHKSHRKLKSLVLKEKYFLVLDGNPSHTVEAIITEIDNNAFNSCEIKELVLPSTMKRIGRNAFSGSSITNIELNEGLQIIESKAFYGSDLKNLIIPSTVTFIDSQAFFECLDLEYIILPSSIGGLYGYTFTCAKQLNDITCKSKTPPTADTTDFQSYFNGPMGEAESIKSYNIDFDRCILFVPRGSEDLYRAAPGWSIFKNIVPTDL